MSTAVGELVLASLYLELDAVRRATLVRAAQALPDWDAALVALEAHGVLGLAHKHLRATGVRLAPEVAARLDARHAVLLRLERGFRVTLERFLAAAHARGIEVTLLKGAALVLETYGPGALRAQGDLDLLVAAHDVPGALAAARAIGLASPRGALPDGWYRRVHFHQKLVPLDGVQRELELHWHLHPPSALLAVEPEELRARRVPLAVGGLRAWTLDPLDAFLHHVTHLARHAPLAGLTRDELVRRAADARAPLRMKWLCDLRAELEREPARVEAAPLLARARAWNAEQELGDALALFDGALELTAAARARVAPVLAALPRSTRGRTQLRRSAPMPGFDLRLASLRGVPRWMFPPRERLAGLHPGQGPLRARLVQATGALGWLARAALLSPPAWLLRRRRVEAALAPEVLLDLAAHLRRLSTG